MSRSAAVPPWHASLSLLVPYAVVLALLVLAPPATGASVASPGVPVVAGSVVGGSVVSVETGDAPVQVRLGSITPAIATPGSGALITGTLSNPGPEPVQVNSLRVSTAYRGLDTRAAVEQWASTGDLETPRVIAEDTIDAVLAPGAVVNFYADAPAQELAPDFGFATLPVRIEVTQGGHDGEEGADSLPASEVRTFLPWHSSEAADFNPVDIAWLAPLTLPGGTELVDPDDATRAAAWAEAIGPGSRNAALVEGLAGTSATFVVDPAVLEPLDPVASLAEAVTAPGEEPEPTTPDQPEATAEPTADPTAQPTEPEPTPASTPGSTPDPTGATGPGPSTGAPNPSAPAGPPGDDEEATSTGGPDEPGSPQEPVEPATPPTTEEAVRALGEQLEALPEDQLWWLPVGDTDSAALLELDRQVSTVATLVGRPPEQTPVATGRTDVAWPLSTAPDDDLLERLERVWRQAGGALGTAGVGQGTLAGAVLPTHAITEDPHTGSAARTHETGVTLLGYDARLSGIVASAGEPDRDGRTVQRFLAETLATYQEQPAEDRSVLVAIPRTAQVDATTLRHLVDSSATAPWLAQTTASALLDAPDPVPVVLTGTAPPDGALTAYSVPDPSPLTTERIEQVERARVDLVGACEIVPGSEEAQGTWLRALDRQYSARWRQGPQGWDEPVELALGVSQEVLEGLTINPTTINFFADEGVIMITVTNDLPLQIDDLRMTIRPGNARLRVLEQPEPITIGPESRATVQFRAKALAAGRVPLYTSLSTPEGIAVGDPAETEVRVRPAGAWIYWLLGGVAGVILVLGLIRALRPRGANEPTAQTDTRDPADPSDPSVPTDRERP